MLRVSLLIVMLLGALDVSARLPEFTDLVKDASPAVVNISATRTVQNRFEDFNDEEVPEFFRRFFRNYPDRNVPRPSAGSGFILSEDGLVSHLELKGDRITLIAR